MPVVWEVRCYVSDGGRDEIKDWYDEQPAKVQNKFFSRMRSLAGLGLDEWRVPLFRWLHDECRPLGEVRFKALGVQYRPLGFRGPKERTFTLVFPAKELNDKFVPKNACTIGLARMKEIQNDHSRSRPLWLRLE